MTKTNFIGEKGCQTLYYVDDLARDLGFPINRFVTINFSVLGVDPKNAVKLFKTIINDRIGKWVSRSLKRPKTDYYYFENKKGDVAYDEIGDGLPHWVHVHWGMHIPPEGWRKFEYKIRKCIDAICGHSDWDESALRIDEVTEGSFMGRYGIKGGVLKAALKYSPKNRIDKICPQGLIVGGARFSTSRNLGPSNRKWRDKLKGINRKANMSRYKFINQIHC